MAQYGGCDDGHFLWERDSQATEQKHKENAEISEVVDEPLKCLHGTFPQTVLKTSARPSIPVSRGRAPLEGYVAASISLGSIVDRGRSGPG
jgi:hypothetical protein